MLRRKEGRTNILEQGLLCGADVAPEGRHEVGAAGPDLTLRPAICKLGDVVVRKSLVLLPEVSQKLYSLVVSGPDLAVLCTGNKLSDVGSLLQCKKLA